MILLPWVLCAQLSAILSAQDRPQFVWQGEVDGIDILYLHGKRLEVKVQEGAPVIGQQFQFHDSLPESRQDVRVEVRQGRGYVHVMDQPRIDNNYTLAVSIEDRQPGSSLYSIAIYWDTSNRSFEGKQKMDQVTWSGRVDDDAVVSCQAKRCTSSPLAADEHFKFSKPLPSRDIEVRLEHSFGRGEIRLAEQPREKNNYTAQVAIRDPQAGSGEYTFTLVWDRNGAANLAPEASAGLIWSGRVQGHIQVTIEGGSAISSVLEGGPVTGEHVDFIRPLPARSDLRPAVKILRGGGRAAIVQAPSAANHFRLAFELTSGDGGGDDYEVEVDW